MGLFKSKTTTKPKSIWKRILRVTTKVILFGFITLLLLEICFRYQVIDFYSSELKAINSEKELHSEGGILVIGDSFSAHPTGYVAVLRKNHPEHSIVNTSIPGTGIRQHMLLASSRISQFKPEKIIYQMYVGNDFMDINHPTNYSETSFIRNLYWSTADNFLFLRYLNRKTAGLRSEVGLEKKLHRSNFSVDQYNKREKILFKVAPSHINDVIHLYDNQADNYLEWKNNFEDLIELCPNVTLLIIPHCAQVNMKYKSQMDSLGAEFSNDINIINYQLINRIKKDYPEVTLINPLKDFQEAEKNGNQLFYDNDPHLNAEGQKILGNVVDKQLFTQ